jgi:hypothetical protein
MEHFTDFLLLIQKMYNFQSKAFKFKELDTT